MSIIKNRDVREIVEWSRTIGYDVEMRGDKLFFTHEKIERPIVIGAAHKVHYDHPQQLRRKLERALQLSGGGRDGLLNKWQKKIGKSSLHWLARICADSTA